ncbi:hypothetical protein SAMD00019534_060530 [Acytostelium subglobosum LB1]|uniref:hypothetical protein n=1 Tax=Acytostelium subglobosum LB1 TaxID=1410327 RepID=UPI000644C46A|nr:hypothetical protein SAMD00019534_060530 [Acytostelium subglobosum LB1]GAM22878.1 hypothetical protein SAMD00019534_060530 [Acytostelium subglobosum LB1]|eukprot:XP_012754105.1 hypothetical protein SAMD00019534_060530 [Acytostelium subglobosum LB1]
MNGLIEQAQVIDVHIDDANKKKKFKLKEKSKKVMDLEKSKKQIEAALAFLKIEKRSVRELRDRFVSVCNEVTALYEHCNTIERDLSKWDIELERLYSKVKEGYFSDYFKLHPVFETCSARIRDHHQVKQDLIRELARREAARIASEIYVSGIIQILECGVDLITDERMVDVARVRGLEHQVHMLYHALHDQQMEMSYAIHMRGSGGVMPPQASNEGSSPQQQQTPPHPHQQQQQQQPSSSGSRGSPKVSPSNTVGNKPPTMVGSSGDLSKKSNDSRGSMGSNSSAQSSPMSSSPPSTNHITSAAAKSSSTPPVLSPSKPAVQTQVQPSQPQTQPQQQAKPMNTTPSVATTTSTATSTTVATKPATSTTSTTTPSSAPANQTKSPTPAAAAAPSNPRPKGAPGAFVMESLIKNTDAFFSLADKNQSSPLLIKTSGYLDTISDLTAEQLIQSAYAACNEGKVYSDSLRVNGSMMGGDQVDVYMASELLKHFFRTANPFLSEQLTQEWLAVDSIEDNERAMEAVRTFIKKMPDENKAILSSLLRLLNKVAQKSLASKPNPNLIPTMSKAFSELVLRTNK